MVALVCALSANLSWTAPKAPVDWTTVSTQFGGVGLDATDPVREFAIAKRIQQIALTSSTGVIVFPEAVVPNWNAATEAFWRKTIQTLQHNGKTLVVGATVPLANGRQHFNSVIIRGAGASADFHQRIPIPIAMWTPFTDRGFPLHLDGPGIADIAGRKTAILICYEQILIWPVLTSFTHRPVLLLAIANEYWARGTKIPEIQRACVTSWSRLFHVPFVWAENT
jgi:apolipoprotein N-acyltransferase